jgi:hypothetical protein
MRIPMPFAAVAHRARDAWSYFRTGVKVEGQAWLCSNEHLQVWVSGMPVKQVPQHVDVELRFWNRRGPRVTVSEIADARIPLFGLVLADGAWPEFKPLTLEPGDPPLEANFVLVPKGAPKVGPTPRVEAFTGAILELEFRPSRGSEPRVDSGATCRRGSTAAGSTTAVTRSRRGRSSTGFRCGSSRRSWAPASCRSRTPTRGG